MRRIVLAVLGCAFGLAAAMGTAAMALWALAALHADTTSSGRHGAAIGSLHHQQTVLAVASVAVCGAAATAITWMRRSKSTAA